MGQVGTKFKAKTDNICCYLYIMKKSLNTDGQQCQKYQQNEPSPQLIEHKNLWQMMLRKSMSCFNQEQMCGRVKSIVIPSLPS